MSENDETSEAPEAMDPATPEPLGRKTTAFDSRWHGQAMRDNRPPFLEERVAYLEDVVAGLAAVVGVDTLTVALNRLAAEKAFAPVAETTAALAKSGRLREVEAVTSDACLVTGAELGGAFPRPFQVRPADVKPEQAAAFIGARKGEEIDVGDGTRFRIDAIHEPVA